MKIEQARTVLTCPGRNFVTVVIETDDGVRGVGDATLNGRELAVASYLDDHVLPLLIGLDARSIEDIWHFLYKGAYWRRGPVTMTAIGAIDMALWDIKGKSLDTPVYNLLGGRARDGVTVYGHANGATIDQAVEAVGRIRRGRVQGRPRAVGLSRSRPALRRRTRRPVLRAGRGRPPLLETFDSGPYLRGVPKLFAAVRDAVGWDVDLLHDVHHRLTPREAAQLGSPSSRTSCSGWRTRSRPSCRSRCAWSASTRLTPIAIGEVFNTLYDCQQLIAEQLIDYIRTAVAHAGGLTHLQRIAHFAELYHVRTACHGPTDLSPINLAATLHFQTAVHNFGLQEYMRHPEQATEVFDVGYWLEDGMLHLDERPGLGVDFDEERAADHPYRRAYLPVARRGDGCVHSW